MKNKIFLLVLLLILPLASATDIAYVVGSSDNAIVTGIFDELNYTYDIIPNYLIPGTDFSQYEMIFVQDDISNKLFLPLNDSNIIFIVADERALHNVAGDIWPGVSISKTQTFMSKFEILGTPFTQGFSSADFQAYTSTKDVFYMRIKPSYVSRVALTTGSSGAYGIVGYSGSSQRQVMFGFPIINSWTNDTKKLFKNSVRWVKQGVDSDNDGYYSNVDCNDNNFSIHPNATEIPYDGIDQNCDGHDLLDVDNDGYCKLGLPIANKTFQCTLELGNIGTDCNDNNLIVNPGSGNVYNNCKNDAPIVQDITNKSYFEGDIVFIKVNATDPENDTLSYKINDSRFAKSGSGFSWATSYNSSGNYTFIVTVSDAEFNITKKVFVEVKDSDRAPISIPIPELNWSEDSNVTLNLSEYFSDPDGDDLIFGVQATSSDKNISVRNISYDIFEFSPAKDWNGNDWIEFFTFDGIQRTVSNVVNLRVINVNDIPEFNGTIENFSFAENTNLTNAINLSDYFSDIDSNLTYSALGNDDNLSVMINNGIIGFYPKRGWHGTEQLIIGASDGEYNVTSNQFSLEILEVNLAPHISYNCSGINEDESGSCLIDVYDEENDSFVLSANSGNNMNCTLDGFNLSYVPYSNYNGNASCQFRLDYANGSILGSIGIYVNPVNDMPEFNGTIENFSFAENTNLTNAINLSDYFSDIDSNLTYSALGNENISVVINNGVVSFYSNGYGSKYLVISAFDGEYNAYSNAFKVNVFPIGRIPLFTNNSCQININEDNSYSCIINIENVGDNPINLSVVSKSNMNCTLDGFNLSYVPYSNYNGNASCQLKAGNSEGFSLYNLNVYVNPVNDPPYIVSYLPFQNTIFIPPSKSRAFNLSINDLDNNNLFINWFLNGERVYVISSKFSNYVFTGRNSSGIYNLTAIGTDNINNVSQSWRIAVGSYSDYTCSEVSGKICMANEICSSQLIGTKDNKGCCISSCMPKFEAANGCDIINNSAVVSIREPSSDKDFVLGDKINVEVQLESLLSDVRDFEIYAYLYNLKNDEIVDEQQDTISLGQNGMRVRTLSLTIPNDIEIDGDSNYAIFVKSDQEGICSQDYSKINIERKLHQVNITSFYVLEQVSCGENFGIKVKMENTGRKSESATLTLSSQRLGIKKSEDFRIGSYGNENDRITKNYEITLPEDANSGNYTISAELKYDNGIARESRNIEVVCEETNVRSISTGKSKVGSRQTVVLNDANSENSQDNKLVLFFMLLPLIAGALAVFYVLAVKTIRNFLN